MTSTLRFLCLLTLSLGLYACGGGSNSSSDSTQPIATGCDPANPDTHDQCGTVLLGLTDADGDFLNYTVDVVSLTLETANGRVVETLPRSTRINFAEYVDLTELFTAATVPPATYVAGTITLNYAAAEVFVEQDGLAREATVVDADGVPLAEASLSVMLSNRDRLVVAPGRPAFLQLDFDLAASHTVDLDSNPALATAEPFIVAEVAPAPFFLFAHTYAVHDYFENDERYHADHPGSHQRDQPTIRRLMSRTDRTRLGYNRKRVRCVLVNR